MYIISDNEATYFEGEALGTEDQLPAGAWGVGYRPMTNAPYFYKIADYKTSHGKIYGDAESFAKHVRKESLTSFSPTLLIITILL